MKLSIDRILTTHVGSLPRSEAVTSGVFAIDRGDQIDLVEHGRVVAEAVSRVVARQVACGVDVVSDGEMSKCGFSTFAGYAGIDPEIAYAKLASLAAGARLASIRLW